MDAVIQPCVSDEQAPGATSPESASVAPAPSTAAARCVQCGWSVSPRRLEIVERDGEQLALHRGGCPDRIEREIEEEPC